MKRWNSTNQFQTYESYVVVETALVGKIHFPLLHSRRLNLTSNLTFSWVMSAIDKIGFRRMPPVGVLPLGTGNDLSRSLDWGPGYTDSCLKKILNQLERANVEQMDRWHIETSEPTRELPLNVMNNYFSIGVDANTSLKFHSERGNLSRTLYLA